MALSIDGSVEVFIGISLLLLAGPLLVVGRRRPESVTLATFLFLVAMNFLLLGIAPQGVDPATTPYGKAAFVALALDPLYLVAFVTLYPYRRRPRRVRWFLGLMAVWAGISALLAVSVDSFIFALFGPQVTPRGFAFPNVVLVAELVVGYLGAWFLSLVAVRDAPTRELARRALWMVAAVGIAVVPRIGLVPHFDLPLSPSLVLGRLGPSTAVDIFLDAALALVVSLAVYALGARWLRRRMPQALRLDADRHLRLILIVVMALFAVHLAVSTWSNLVAEVGQGLFYGARWLIFAAMLVYGILAYEVVDFPRASQKAVPFYGGLLAGLAGFLVVDALAVALGESETVSASLGIAVGFGIAAPAGLGTRELVRRLETAPSAGTERRLELYRAAAEAASARGPPTSQIREQLERDRRAFGVSYDEARTLEHVVTADAVGRSRGVAMGDEAAPGLVLGPLLGEGAHGRVFEGTRYPGGERVVIKEMRSDRLGRAEMRRRMLDEVRALQALNHPNIMPLLDVHVRGGTFLLVMKHVPARTFESRLRDGPVPPDDLGQKLADLLSALEAAHQAGVVHRDVKPSNILLGEDGRAYLTDFGIAALQPRRGGMTAANLTALDGMAGTPAYMAPEQVLGGEVGPATDLYAVGLVAFEGLVGGPAQDIAHRPAFEVLERIAHPKFDLQRAPARWRPWLARALAADPAKRFATAAEMRLAMPSAEAPGHRSR